MANKRGVKLIAEFYSNHILWIVVSQDKPSVVLYSRTSRFSKDSRTATGLAKAVTDFLGDLDSDYVDQIHSVSVVLNTTYCLIPWHYYDEGHQASLLKLEGAQEPFSVISIYQSNTNAYFIFELPDYIQLGLEKMFKVNTITYKHEALLFDDLTRRSTELRKKEHLYANISDQRVTIVHAGNGKVNFFNSFDIFHQKDLVYYLLLTIQELNLPKEDLVIQAWGKHEEYDSALKQLESYVSHVERNLLNDSLMKSELTLAGTKNFSHLLTNTAALSI